MTAIETALPATNATLIAIIENQVARTEAAFEGMDASILTAEPGHDCNSVLRIGHHLVGLRQFMLKLLESPRATNIASPDDIATIDQLLSAIHSATKEVIAGVREHDAEDWMRTPEATREGPWGDEPTLARFVRPLNDFANHLGSIRAIRRLMGNPNDRTQ
ncbi:MAG: DinB family protein [Planctomycetota bacterium]